MKYCCGVILLYGEWSVILHFGDFEDVNVIRVTACGGDSVLVRC